MIGEPPSLPKICNCLLWFPLTFYLTVLFLFETRLLDKKHFTLCSSVPVLVLFRICGDQYNISDIHDLLGRYLRAALSSYHPKVKLFVMCHTVAFRCPEIITMLPLQWFRNWVEIMEKTLVHPHTNIIGFLQE
jgi:hypothetical protein